MSSSCATEATASANQVAPIKTGMTSDPCLRGAAARTWLDGRSYIFTLRSSTRSLPSQLGIQPSRSNVHSRPRSKIDASWLAPAGWRRHRLLRARDETSGEPSRDKPDTGGHETPSLGVSIAETRAGVTIVDVKPRTPAAGSLLAGDVILEVNHAPLRNAAEVSRLVNEAPRQQPILLKIRRGNQERFVGIERGR
jgi:hypothetical protein